MSYIHKNGIAGRLKGCSNYPLEFKQRLAAAPVNSTSLSQNWRQGKLQLSSSPEVNMPELLPVTLDAEIEPANQLPPHPAESEALPLSCEITFRHSILRLNGTVSRKSAANADTGT
ncbi:IS66 family insertion sequence element accessory protein TnpB [Serratia plymuthica]|uniref:IS66 family insertion sequence element accessory protein TnpB n=1 Tax=Serratia plymuthica TaxID=82996 RepID=UPI001EF0B19A|nr:IS66 family insertion sequence element accessory protein TnpB [Serratia plymuthica]